MILRHSFLHNVDISKSETEEIQLQLNSGNITTYIQELLNEILTNPNRRIFTFKAGNTEVKSSLLNILNNDNLEEIVKLNADRLLEKEKRSQEFINSRNLNIQIQKGSLMHLHFTDEDVSKIIICKVEHDEILSEQNFEKVSGLNTKRKVFKAILVVFNENQTLSETIVFDKNNSRYWWDEFLELEQINTDGQNTEKSLAEIDNVLRSLKKDYHADYTILRNGIISHFRNNEQLNFSDILDSEVVNYVPINENFPKQRLIAQLVSLPAVKGFDSQFTIVRSKIKKRIQQKIKLAPNLYLTIDDTVENLRNLIRTKIDAAGNKIVEIISNEGYEQLKDFN